MGRVIKTNLGKYANPKLAQGAKRAVLASVVEYLNGEEYVRIVTAPLTYQSPDFVRAMEKEQEAVGVAFSPTNQRRYCRIGRCQCYGVAALLWLLFEWVFFRFTVVGLTHARTMSVPPTVARLMDFSTPQRNVLGMVFL